jgi:hypothetical protein
MFAPIETTLGALLLHVSTSTLFFNNGSVLGQSGLLRGLLTRSDVGSALIFGGMALSTLPWPYVSLDIQPTYPSFNLKSPDFLRVLGLGVLTAWGTKVRLSSPDSLKETRLG